MWWVSNSNGHHVWARTLFSHTCRRDCEYQTYHAWVIAKWCHVKFTHPLRASHHHVSLSLSGLTGLGSDTTALLTEPRIICRRTRPAVMECIDFPLHFLFFCCRPAHWIVTLNDCDKCVRKWKFWGGGWIQLWISGQFLDLSHHKVHHLRDVIHHHA